ncbi:MAG: YbaK/EbsC family protein [Patescibacteria group bacterium]|jgi:Ala-tRNA(Pro) deacylase
MSISKRLLSLLEKSKIKYNVVTHRKVFTVYDLAQTLKVKMNTIAKTLLVKVDREYRIIVIPAHFRLDLKKLASLLKAKKVIIAPEKDMQNKFKSKPGAMTPFGSLYKVGVVLDRSLLKLQKPLFHAGSFTESLRLKIKDYVKLEQPVVGAFVSSAKKKK